MRNPLVQELCQSHSVQNLSEIHPTLANSDKIQLILQKHQISSYPFGQDIEAVQHYALMQKQNNTNPVGLTNSIH